jgi:hypothetical protein
MVIRHNRSIVARGRRAGVQFFHTASARRCLHGLEGRHRGSPHRVRNSPFIVTRGVDSPSIFAATPQIATSRPAPFKQVPCQPLTDEPPEYRLLGIDHGNG